MSVKPSRPPPRAPKKPGKVNVMRAMYRYDAQRNDELSFEEDDVLYITDQSDSRWWRATCGNRSGLIPSNFVENYAASVDFPLHEAAKRGNEEFLSECLHNGVSVNGLDKAGCTALHWASQGGHVQCALALLAVCGCEVNVQNKLGDTPLHCAAWRGHMDVVSLLLENWAKKDICNAEGKVALDLSHDAETKALLVGTVDCRLGLIECDDNDDSD